MPAGAADEPIVRVARALLQLVFTKSCVSAIVAVSSGTAVGAGASPAGHAQDPAVELQTGSGSMKLYAEAHTVSLRPVHRT